MVENLFAVQEMRVQSLPQEDPLEKEMATRSRILSWEIPLTEEPGGLQSVGSQKSWTWLSDFHFTLLLLHCRSILYPLNYEGSLF